jgi:hypothetical protein
LCDKLFFQWISKVTAHIQGKQSVLPRSLKLKGIFKRRDDHIFEKTMKIELSPIPQAYTLKLSSMVNGSVSYHSFIISSPWTCKNVSSPTLTYFQNKCVDLLWWTYDKWMIRNRPIYHGWQLKGVGLGYGRQLYFAFKMDILYINQFCIYMHVQVYIIFMLLIHVMAFI